VADFFLNAGDTASPIFETLEDDNGAAVDLQGATIHVTVTPIRGGTPIIDAAANNLQVGDGSDGTKGQVSYGEGAAPYTGSQTATAGDYLYQWRVTFSGGGIQTFPNDGYRLLTIQPDAPTTAGRYLQREELKKTLSLSNESYADADIDVAIEAASRGLEAAYGTVWTLGASTTEVRYYTATGRTVSLGDVIKVTEIALDYTPLYPSDDYPYGFAGSGTYSTILSSGDYRLLPVSPKPGLAVDGGNGEPFHSLQLTRVASLYTLPSGVDAIRVTGQFGWERVPAGVRNAATIIAIRLLKRAREGPFGIISLDLAGSTIRATQIASDPEISFAVEAVRPARSLIV
jgi:hypothetical protein